MPLTEGQLVHNVFADCRRCCGGERDDRSAHHLADLPYLQIVRAEIITPLGDTVRLVHHQKGNGKHIEIGTEQPGAQALRGDIQEFAVSVGGIVEGCIHFPAGHTGMYGNRVYASGFKVLDLVLHKGDQRSNDKREPVHHHCGHLEADGFSASRRKKCEHVTTLQGRAYYLFLHRAERIVAPIFFKYT